MITFIQSFAAIKNKTKQNIISNYKAADMNELSETYNTQTDT